MLLVAVEPENTSRTVRCVLLYRAGGCCMLCVSHCLVSSRGDAEKLEMTMTRNTLALHINARVKFKGKCESGEILYVGLVHDSAKHTGK